MASSHSNTRQLQQQQRPERSSPHHRPWSEPRRTSVRVKHSMRKSPYLVSLVFLLAATSLTILNIYAADLIRVISFKPGPSSFETKYGLYQRCVRQLPVPALLYAASPLLQPTSDLSSSFSLFKKPSGRPGRWKCEPFPTRSECNQFGEGFCVLWDTAGYAAQLALVPCLFALVSLLFIFLHRGKRSARARARRSQWKLVSGAMLVHCLLQIISIGLIIRAYNTDERFAHGAHLSRSLYFGIAAALTSALTLTFLTFTGMAARRGEPWAAGRSARQARRHKRTRSGRVITVPEGTYISEHEAVTVGEVVEAATGAANEHTALLSASSASSSLDAGHAGGGLQTTYAAVAARGGNDAAV